MPAVTSSLCLLYFACALLYQADDRRSPYAQIKQSKPIRFGLRSGAGIVFAISLLIMAPLQGWLRGVPIWLGLLSFAFVFGLFLAAQKPSWHAPSAMIAGGVGILATAGAIL
ncbi:MAG: hypothetical protein HRT80_15140 [Henriciella sp.]|nr:hypothetical protein [Henriciella sp.]